MENFVVFRVLLIFTVILPICKTIVEISQPSSEVCLGTAVEFNCTVNGTILGWRYGGDSGVNEFYVSPTGSTSLVLLGLSPFRTRVTSVSGGIITSIATTSNLTRDANEMTLECSNGSFVSDITEISRVTLPQDSSAVQSISAEPLGKSSEIFIHIYWQETACAPSYELNIMSDSGIGNIFIPTVNTYVRYSANSDLDIYTISVNNIDNFGVRSVPISTRVRINLPDVAVNSSFNCDSNVSFVIIQDSVDSQLPIISCNVTLTDGGSYDCTQQRVFEFPGIINGQIYNYSVNVRNVLGSKTIPAVINVTCIEPSVTTITETITETTSFCSMTCSTQTPCPTVTPCTPCPEPPECELCSWALIVIIILGVLFVSGVVFITLELWWRLRCCNLDCWDSIFWTYLFCDCLKKCCPKGEKFRAINKGTESPDGKETKM